MFCFTSSNCFRNVGLGHSLEVHPGKCRVYRKQCLHLLVILVPVSLNWAVVPFSDVWGHFVGGIVLHMKINSQTLVGYDTMGVYYRRLGIIILAGLADFWYE